MSVADRVTRVGIAIVEDAGRFLVGVRPDGVPLAGAAEFPGGKCEAGESPAACAERECLEETGVAVTAIMCVETRTHTYPHGTVEVHFWRCQPIGMSEPLLGSFRWVEKQTLAELPFPEANASVLQKLLTEN